MNARRSRKRIKQSVMIHYSCGLVLFVEGWEGSHNLMATSEGELWTLKPAPRSLQDGLTFILGAVAQGQQTCYLKVKKGDRLIQCMV